MILVNVHAGNCDNTLKTLKKKSQRELIFRKMKEQRYYETRSAKRVRKGQEAARRIRKVARKQMFDNM
ncbi:30S ribosomal protein S21 [Rickettsia endosymbiont of Halotydeus destructor]|uniref:30S ribosomal protein S21 n=1 Tax=Rickettsia endosymbiont of Halotydeus destructor TaxID=2996754 RepID=UPI003BB1E2B2